MRPFKGTLLMIMVAVPLLGCQPPRSNPALFEQQVRDWVPIGTSVDAAAATMGEHGFAILRSNRPSGEAEYLSCTRYRVSPAYRHRQTKPTGDFQVSRPGAETEWTVLLIVQNEQISSIETEVTTRGRE